MTIPPSTHVNTITTTVNTDEHPAAQQELLALPPSTTIITQPTEQNVITQEPEAPETQERTITPVVEPDDTNTTTNDDDVVTNNINEQAENTDNITDDADNEQPNITTAEETTDDTMEVDNCSRQDQDTDTATATAELVSTTENDDTSTTSSATITTSAPSHSMQLRTRGRVDYSSFHKKGATQLIQVARKKLKQKRVKVHIRDMFRKVAAIIMSHMGQASSSEHDQLSVREGIRRFGQQAVDAVLKEYAQLHDMNTFKPMDPNKLSKQEKRKALNLIKKIKKKMCGRIKARGLPMVANNACG